MKQAVTEIPFKALERLLQVPEGISIVAAEARLGQENIALKLEGDSLPTEHLPAGQPLQKVTMAYKAVPMNVLVACHLV